jgi:hypothetical protein
VYRAWERAPDGSTTPVMVRITEPAPSGAAGSSRPASVYAMSRGPSAAFPLTSQPSIPPAAPVPMRAATPLPGALMPPAPSGGSHGPSPPGVVTQGAAGSVSARQHTPSHGMHTHAVALKVLHPANHSFCMPS